MQYRALRTISTVFKVLGWIVLVGGILGTCAFSGMAATGALGLMGQGDEVALAGVAGMSAIVVAVVGFVVGIIISGLYALFFFAASDLIRLAMDAIGAISGLEANTRGLVEAVQYRAVAPDRE